jgi:hypothetical protein
MAEPSLALGGLQEWFLSRCDGEWEHSFGIEIETLDNPGWAVRIDLSDTELETRSFEAVKVERADDDWVYARVEDGRWQGACSPLALDELFSLFLAWAESP